MIDVQHHRLSALEQDALAFLAQRVHPLPHRLRERQDLRRQSQQMRQHRLLGEGLRAQFAQQRVVVAQQLVELQRHRFGLGEIGDTDRPPGHPVLVRGTDAAARGADFGVTARRLTRFVQRGMERQDQRRVLGDPQRFR